jgi:type II secretory pathway pseudopilin PulG
MKLAGQGNRGYAMAALLVGMSVMAVLMGALLPVWTTMAKREKEAELVFRGNQYARAIGLFQRKFANTPPPSIDLLVEQRFLRKKYKDPITNDDFQPLYANQAMMPGGAGPGGQPLSGQRAGTPPAPGRQLIQTGFGATGATAAGGIIGVTSKSKETSLKVFNGRTKYNEWAFVHVQTSQQLGQPGIGGPVRPGAPNQRPGPGGQQGQPPSPFGMPPGAFPNPNQRQGMPMPPPGLGPSRPPFPGGSPFGGPGASPIAPSTIPPQLQPRPGQRPPGQ